MDIKNYDFLDAIYEEYTKAWIPFDNLNGKPYLQEFYFNNQSFGTINRTLKSIAGIYYHDLEQMRGDFEGTMLYRAERLSTYWNYIQPIYHNWQMKNGADGYYDYEHNYMYALYQGTQDCVIVLMLAYAKKGLRFDTDLFREFEDLDSLSDRAHELELYSRDAFRDLINNIPIADTIGKCDNSKKGNPSAISILVSNPTSKKLLDILVDKGYCKKDGRYSWNSEHNNYERAYAANIIGELAGIPNPYRIFENLWGCRYLSSDFSKAGSLKREASKKKIEILINILRAS